MKKKKLSYRYNYCKFMCNMCEQFLESSIGSLKIPCSHIKKCKCTSIKESSYTHVFHRFMSTEINVDDDNKMEITISTLKMQRHRVSSLFIESSIANTCLYTETHARICTYPMHKHTHTHIASLNFRVQSITFSKYFNDVI